MQKKKGISLIVLIITIIVMIILASVIILSLNNSGIISKAEEAVDKTNLSEIQHLATLAWSEEYLEQQKNGKIDLKGLEDAVKAALGDEYDKYYVEVTTSGVTVKERGTTVEVVSEEILGVDGQFKYVKLNNNQIQITRYLGSSDTVVFPASYDNYKVYAIGNVDADPASKEVRYNVFGATNTSTNTSIKSITISEGIQEIKLSSFYRCSALEGNLILPSTLKEIGPYAFVLCSGLTGDLTIPDSVSKVGVYAFAKCTGFNGNLKLSSNLKTIEKCTFLECTGLTGELNIPEGITVIGGNAFSKCKNLSGTLKIPKGVATIDEFAFNGCEKFSGDLTIPEGVISIEKYAFQLCTGLNGKLTLPSTLEVISDGAFNHCVHLTNETLTIPKSVKRIGLNENDASHVFHDFAVATIKEYVVEAGNEKFKAEDGVLYSKDGRRLVAYPTKKTDETYEILEGTTIIDELAFSYASNIKKVILPNSYVITPTLPENYLNTGNNLAVGLYVRTTIEDIEVKADNPNYISQNGAIYSKDGKTLWYVAAIEQDTINILEGVTTIKNGALFCYTEETSKKIYIPSSVIEIDERPLQVLNQMGVENVTFADGCIYGVLEDGTIGKKQ